MHIFCWMIFRYIQRFKIIIICFTFRSWFNSKPKVFKKFTNLNDSLRILKPEIREKISIVYDLKDADYVIDNHIKKWNSTPGEETLKNDFSIFYELIVDGNVINTVYKRNWAMKIFFVKTIIIGIVKTMCQHRSRQGGISCDITEHCCHIRCNHTWPFCNAA